MSLVAFSLLASILTSPSLVSAESHSVQLSARTKVGLSLMATYPINEDAYLTAAREQIRFGVETFYISVKWEDFFAEGKFSPKPLQDQLGIAKLLGVHPVVCLKLIDTNNRSAPGGLLNIKMDDPVFVKAWEDTLVAISKLLPKDVEAIALGNEVDVYFREHPEEVDAFLNLVRSGRSILKGAGFTAPVGTITTFEGISKDRALVQKLQAPWDIAFFTYYPITSIFEVLPPQSITTHVQLMREVTGGRPFALTEIGYPASELNKSSDQLQSQFIREMFSFLMKAPNPPVFVNYFSQTDFAPPVLDYLENYYRLKDDRFRGYLGSLGLKDSEGRRRSSYAEFAKQMQIWTAGEGKVQARSRR